jgi:hypothetical protein
MYSRRLKKKTFGTAPALRASAISLRPSSRIFPCFSRNGLDLTIVITLLWMETKKWVNTKILVTETNLALTDSKSFAEAETNSKDTYSAK